MPLNQASNDLYNGYATPIAGFLTETATTGATTLLTIPAGRIFQGSITITCATQQAAAATTTGQATGVVSTAGTGVVPAAGAYWRCDALAGANVATGLTGDEGSNSATFPSVYVQAPAANVVTLTLTTTQSGTTSQVSASASGLII